MIELNQIQQEKQIHDSLSACPIESSVDLQVLTGLKTYRLHTRLVGLDGVRSVLLAYGKGGEWPKAEQYLQSCQPVVLHILNETGFCQVLAFRSEIETVIQAPRKLISITFPRTLELARLRQVTRVELHEECELLWRTEPVPAPPNKRMAAVKDLSMTGCKVSAKLSDSIPKGTQIQLKSAIWNSHLSGTVCNVRHCESGVKHYGIEFTNLTPPMESLVGQLMLRQLNARESLPAE